MSIECDFDSMDAPVGSWTDAVPMIMSMEFDLNGDDSKDSTSTS